MSQVTAVNGMKNYRFINKNPLSCKDYKSLKTHKKLFPV